MTHLRELFLLALISATALFPGCSKSFGWSVAPSVVESNCCVEQLRCDGRTFLVIAASGCASATSDGEGDGSFKGEFLTHDGRKIAWSCSSNDGIGGSLTIDGQDFDLGNGAVFLVHTNEPSAVVQQNDVEMSKLQNPLTPDRPLEVWSSLEPRIAEFVTEAEELQ